MDLKEKLVEVTELHFKYKHNDILAFDSSIIDIALPKKLLDKLLNNYLLNGYYLIGSNAVTECIERGDTIGVIYLIKR